MTQLFSRIAFAFVACLWVSSCSSGVDFPDGSSEGYRSFRIVQKNPSTQTSSTEDSIHRMIQSALKAQFSSNGIKNEASDADLIVSYLVIYQNDIMTTFYDAYFGSAGNAEEISELAHKKGVVEGKNPNSFERAGLVISVFDAQTNELIHRDYAAGDLVRGASDAVRQKRTRQAVAIALGKFFE